MDYWFMSTACRLPPQPAPPALLPACAGARQCSGLCFPLANGRTHRKPLETPTAFTLKYGEYRGKHFAALCKDKRFELLQLKDRRKLLKQWKINSFSQTARVLGVLGGAGLLQAVASADITGHNYSCDCMMLSLSYNQHLGSGLAFGRLYAPFKPLG